MRFQNDQVCYVKSEYWWTRSEVEGSLLKTDERRIPKQIMQYKPRGNGGLGSIENRSLGNIIEHGRIPG